jgi:hypothetical protein
LFAAFQVALTFAVLLGVTAGLHGEEWFADRISRLFHAWSLQAYALGLALLSLFWVIARRLLRSQPRAQALLEPGWRTVDAGVLALTVVGQLALAIYGTWPEIVDELVPLHLKGIFLLWEPYRPLAVIQAWALLGILIAALGILLWDRRPHEAVIGLLVSALTLALLAAYGFRGELAAGSAGRWTLAVCFLACSALLWARERLFARAERFGIS